MSDDATLLRQYATERAGDAFAEIVRRHLPFVYSSALRRLGGDAHRAQDVAQVVFCALARDAERISRTPALAGWLYTATRNAAIDFIRAEKRRRAREQEAYTMQQTAQDLDSPADWSQLRPVLDVAMDQLSQRDRDAVLMRFFQGRPFAEIGAVIGLSEDAARKRVERALEKLRDVLRPRGIVSTSAALAALLSNQAIVAAPPGLAASISGLAVATGAATTSGVVAFLAMTKLQLGLAAVVVAGGAAALFTQQRAISALRANDAAHQARVVALSAENAFLAKSRHDAQVEVDRLQREVTALNAAAQVSARSGQTTKPAPAPKTESVALQKRKADLHTRYDSFLQKWGLTPAQADRFVELKLAIYEAQDDLQSAVRQAGAQGGTKDVEAMRSKLVGGFWNEIRQLLGPEGYRAYGDFESSSFYRGAFVEPMNATFARAQAALSDAQLEQMVAIVAANDRPERVNASDISTRSRIDWDQIVSQSKAILTPAQQSVLESYAARQKTGQPLR